MTGRPHRYNPLTDEIEEAVFSALKKHYRPKPKSHKEAMSKEPNIACFFARTGVDKGIAKFWDFLDD